MKGDKNMKPPNHHLRSYVERLVLHSSTDVKSGSWEARCCGSPVLTLCPPGIQGRGSLDTLLWGFQVHIQNSYSPLLHRQDLCKMAAKNG